VSWDVTLRVPGVSWASESWNYTSNTSPMIYEAMRRAGIPLEHWPGSNAERWRMERFANGSKCGKRGPGQKTLDDLIWTPCTMTCCEPSWWQTLDGRPGPEGLKILVAVVEQWDADPDRFRAMNPRNGWGRFDTDEDDPGLRGVFTEMIAAATTEAALVWEASG